MLGQFKIKIGGQLRGVIFEKCRDIARLNEAEKQFWGSKIHSILADCWGRFPGEFVDRHVFQGNGLIMAKVDDDYIGCCVLNLKKICGRDVHYVELLAVKRMFQKLKVGPRLFYLAVLDDIKRNIFSLVYKPMEIMFITPNIRVLAHIIRFASFVYPNPFLADEEGNMPQADDLTWEMAKELIKHSDKPNRKLHREGLILHGSYSDTPWLIYNPGNAPWVDDPKISKFIKKYMGYHNGEDKELVVRAHITLWSIVKYFYRYLFK